MGRAAGSLNRKMSVTGRPTSAKWSVTTVQSPAGVGRVSGATAHDDSNMPTVRTANDRLRIVASNCL